jgi:hypothetical protein
MTLREIIKELPEEALDYTVVVRNFYDNEQEFESVYTLTNNARRTVIIEYDE